MSRQRTDRDWIERTADKIVPGNVIRTQWGEVTVDRVEAAPTPGYTRIHGRDRSQTWCTLDRRSRNPVRLVIGL